AAALAEFDKAIELFRVFPDAHHNRGAALIKLGRRHEALVALQAALDQKPTLLAARGDLANLLAELRHGEKSPSDTSQIAIDVDILNALGRIYLDRREHELARRTFHGVWLRDPTSLDARTGLADAYHNLEDP